MTSKFRKILSSTIAGSLLICSVIGSTMSVSAATASKYEYSVTDSTQLQKYLVRLGDLTDTQKVLYDIDKTGTLNGVAIALYLAIYGSIAKKDRLMA